MWKIFVGYWSWLTQCHTVFATGTMRPTLVVEMHEISTWPCCLQCLLAFYIPLKYKLILDFNFSFIDFFYNKTPNTSRSKFFYIILPLLSGLPSDLFPSCYLTKLLHAFLFSPCLLYFISRHFIP